jgi:shikimate kinase
MDAQRPRKNLALIGYRGCGKSRVGRRLADRLGLAFADADIELERRAGRPIAAIFQSDGEPAFRDLEESTLADLSATHRGILATGGGAILRPSNRERLRDWGFVVWLQATPAAIRSRLSRATDRPSLTGRGFLDEIEEVLAARSSLYAETADVAIDTTGLEPDAVEAAIIASWRQAEGA